MPMIDVFIPEGSLSAGAEATLMSDPTEILFRSEGLDPTNLQVREVS